MVTSDAIQELAGQVFTMVNHQALDTWLRFGTTRLPGTDGGGRVLQGAELLRWARQRVRQASMLTEERKRGPAFVPLWQSTSQQ